MDRMLVDHFLRAGHYTAALRLAESSGIEVGDVCVCVCGGGGGGGGGSVVCFRGIVCKGRERGIYVCALCSVYVCVCCMIPYKFKGTAMPIYNIWH